MVTLTALSPTRQALKAINEDIARSKTRKEWVKWVAQNIEPVLPKGCTLPSNSYSYSPHSLEINIEKDDDRQWQGLDGTAGLIFKIRKALGIAKLKRHVYTSGETIFQSFYGNASVDDKPIYVTIRVSDLPPTCTVEYTEEDVPATTRKVARVVCA